MDVSSVLDPLNPPQREAVAAPYCNVMVLAGAGSGKTRVLTHRIAWYVRTQQCSPLGILAVTFTNKAAAEMRSRIAALLDVPIGGMWIGTFHGLNHRILRAHWQEANLVKDFTILDSDDQYRTIRRVLRTMAIDEESFPPRAVQGFINAKKDEGLRPQHIADRGDPQLYQMVQIYQAYEEACQRSGVVDFAELLLRTHELLRDQQAILEKYRQRFKLILVDEFQDTNPLQYAWLRLLVGDRSCLFAVGDDDQCIYSWRGARVEHVQQFKKDFAEPLLIKLEQNYRSTTTILKAANALIDHNKARLGKQLWSDGDAGDKIALYNAYNERDEARYVVEQIARPYKDNAILYRVSAQSRAIEEQLMRADMPYRVYGGMRFYERAEIKDALAYVRLAVFHDDDVSFERIVNMPSRGIGQRTLTKLRDIARQEKCSMWQAAHTVLQKQSLSARASGMLESFVRLILSIADGLTMPIDEMLDQAIKVSGLIEHYRKEKGERGLARIENLEELVKAAGDFTGDPETAEDTTPLQAFLDHAVLESGETQSESYDDFVSLMTLHSAKGLEFPQVYLIGVEEGLCPHQRNIDDPEMLEEERRLCYVGITRAEKALTISYAQHRRLHGRDYYPNPSRFIGELPEELIDAVRMDGSALAPMTKRAIVNDALTDNGAAGDGAQTGYRLGQQVSHTKFGHGVILDLEGSGKHVRLQVNFEQVGHKWLVAEYAKLTTI